MSNLILYISMGINAGFLVLYFYMNVKLIVCKKQIHTLFKLAESAGSMLETLGKAVYREG